ncbi:hypothetical protein COY62_01290 [bacterium (Candidatus Howlettbacteria) CG_4_10_14_0_8_um_filter_40_9]|nr:MAG: hypothetical protein COY62_01290 [bacterium (Candidatus Howlettbacteria) CG_4_10_14_0_8_um_filter_40_9]
MTTTTIILIIVAVLAVGLIVIYNGLITTRNRVDEAWNDIKIQLKRRFELIPDLMKTVQAAIKLDEKLLTEITKLRSQAADMDSKDAGPAERADVEGQLNGLMGQLKIQVEAYPDIKSHGEISQFMTELTDTQDKIMAAQRFYNGMVRDFNTKIQVFPTNMFALMLGFKAYEFFEVTEAEQMKSDIKLDV